MLSLMQDITLVDNVQVPLISLIGGIGLVAVSVLLIWRLIAQVLGLQASLERVYRRLSPLLPSAAENASEIDEERLRKLGEILEKAPLLKNAWPGYRRSLMVDGSRWYDTPLVYATRNAAEVFTVEALFYRVNLSFYRSLPAMLTGTGLLLTFIAFFIGLSKIQILGTTITGLPGLINGLSGKFLTSIVGMFCAVVFSVVEKILLHRLLSTYQATVARLDLLFPSRTTSDFLFELTQYQGESARLLKYVGMDIAQQLRKGLTDTMGTPVADLTTAVRSLRIGQPQALPDLLQRELAQRQPQTSAMPVNGARDWEHLSGAFERLEAGAIRQEQLLGRLAEILLPLTDILPKTRLSSASTGLRGATPLKSTILSRTA
jgi:hypothetical protein